MSTSVQAGAYAEGFADGKDKYSQKLILAKDLIVQKDAEIAKLQALVSEAREIITIMQPSCLSGCISAEPSGNGLNAYNHPVLVRARAFLERTGK